MLFHTWPFLVFLVIVLPVFFALRRTRLWIPWLLAASYFFYGWWNPWYLLLVVYATTLDYLLVTFMDYCPRDGAEPCAGQSDDTRPSPGSGTLDYRLQKAGLAARALRLQFDDQILRAAYLVSISLLLGLIVVAIIGPATLRPALFAFAILVLLMAVGALFSSRRIWLLISLFNNLALLLFFKYAGFLADNLNEVLAWLGTSIELADPATLMPYGFQYVLPVGISFFTFQSMSYTIDFYLGKCARERNFLRFATFVCFFPQLMAGPIERARNLLPQFHHAPGFRLQNLTDGLSLFLVGLFKKLALANYLSLYVERVYDNPKAFDAPALIVATIAFAWQIFFDFSGYTDMARGVARMMGFNLILNFNNPYMATGLGEFWARWHISLSTWFRDYLYIPLGGNRRGTLVTYRNLFITFLISGIWHGAAWTFAIWGILHALGVMLTRELERSAFYRHRIPGVLKQAWVFAYVCFAWIFFRAGSLEDALLIVSRIFTAAWSGPQIPAMMLTLVCLVWLYEFLYESRFRDVLKLSFVRVGLAVCMMLYLCLCSSGGGTFIYFQF
ncbi:MAG: MBOAT family protein [Planctomycetota bacterium]|nr:MBOAT family protein [Planctomycetota bacterium]